MHHDTPTQRAYSALDEEEEDALDQWLASLQVSEFEHLTESPRCHPGQVLCCVGPEIMSERGIQSPAHAGG